MINLKNKTVAGISGRAILSGWTSGIGVTLAGTALCASLISVERISAGSMGYCALTVLLAASVVTSASAGKENEKKLYHALAASTLYLATLLSVTALFFGGQYHGVGVTALVIFSGCILGVLPRRNRRKGTKLRKNKSVRR